jgi:DinB superfamily
MARCFRASGYAIRFMETTTLSPKLSKLISEFSSATDRVVKMQREYSDEQWQRKPGPERWSAIECIWHLNWTSEKMIQNIRLAMKGLEPKHQEKYTLDFVGWFLAKSLSAKSRFAKFKTTAPFVSQSTMNIAEVLGRFRELQEGMIRAIRESEGLPLGKGRVESPFNSRVHYNVYSAFWVTAVHEHRHLDQAERAAMGK